MTGSDAERSRSESAAWDQFEAWRLFGGNKRLDFNWRQRALLTLASWCFRSYQRFVTDSLSWNLHDPYGVDDAIRRKKQNFILAVWHNRLIGAISFFDRFHVRVQYSSRIGPLVSESFDGELIARSIRDVNGENVRGSSSRNAVAGLEACGGGAQERLEPVCNWRWTSWAALPAQTRRNHGRQAFRHSHRAPGLVMHSRAPDAPQLGPGFDTAQVFHAQRVFWRALVGGR